MHILDYTVFLLYLFGIFAVGVGLALKNRSARDMFAAGGESPWWTSGLSGFMTMVTVHGPPGDWSVFRRICVFSR